MLIAEAKVDANASEDTPESNPGRLARQPTNRHFPGQVPRPHS
jgi:hypothetical protein